MILGAVGVLVFVLGSAKCAIRLFDYPSIYYDSQWSPSLTSLDALDPRNQAAGSSYAMVENSNGARVPSTVTRTKTAAEPEAQHSTYERVNESRSNKHRPKPKYEDSSSSREHADHEARSRRVSATRPRPEESKERKVSSEPQSSTSAPKSVNEIVEKGTPPLEEAGSSKSGKYLGGDGGGFEEGYDREKHYDKEGGKKFVEAHKQEGGEKAHKARKEEEAYDKAEKAHHAKEAKKEAISEKEGHKKGHLEEEKHHGEEHKKQDGEKQFVVNKVGGREKGRSKKGYKKIHNLNEFQVNEEFYEKGHDKDEKEEGVHEHEAHAKERGGAAKKNSHDSGYHEGHKEGKYLEDKAGHDEQAAGHKKEAAEQEHHDEHSEYGKKGGVKEGGKYGHAEKAGHDGGYFEHDGGF